MAFPANENKLCIYVMDKYEKKHSQLISTSILELNVNYHIALTYRNKEFEVYYDGKFVHKMTIDDEIKNTNRISNYIGKNNWASEDPYEGILDEFKIFDRVLSIDEINHEMNKKQPYFVL